MCGNEIISLLFLGVSIYLIYRFMNGWFKNITNKFTNDDIHDDIDIKYNRDKNTKQHEIDAILDKIHKVGFNNLTDIEKQKLEKF